MNISPAKARALSILRILADEKGGVTLKELADRLGPGTYAGMGNCYAHGPATQCRVRGVARRGYEGLLAWDHRVLN